MLGRPSALRSALAPRPGPWGVAPGLRAALAAVLVLGGSLVGADLSLGGIAYLGVACAAAFIGTGDHRARVVRVAAQTVGAAAGMIVGALVPGSAPWVIAAAVVVGTVAGMVGCIGPASTGAAVMAVIGVSYTQFGRLSMPWWEPVTAYAVGSAVLLGLGLVGALHHRRQHRLDAVAAVLDAAADLLDRPSDDARHRLALASAAAREAVAGYRGTVAGPLDAAWAEARAGAALAAQAVAASAAAPADPAGWRARAAAIRAGDLGDGPAGPPLPGSSTRVRSALQAASNADALWTGARIGLCVGVATALALALHPPTHAYWIALTVAVVLRPEYGAVLVRAVHRLAGTIVGVVLVAVVLELTRSPVLLAVAAAAALGLAGLARPRLYGLAVVGITGSALFSIAVGDPVAVEPWARLLDTVLGCAVALVAGVLLWPRRGVPDQPRRFSAAAAALSRMLRSSGAAAVDEAHLLAHGWRAELERDLAEPDPAHAAAAWLPVALQLEHVVDLAAATADPAAADLLEGAATPSGALALLTAVAEQLRSSR